MYNMGFRIGDVLMEIMFVREMLLAGLPVKRISRTAYSVTGVPEEWVDRIMKHTDKWWFF